MGTRGHSRNRYVAALTAGSLLAGGLVLGGVPGGVPQAQAAPGEPSIPISNPDLTKACGIDINVVLDESGSVKNYKRDVQTAFRAFTGALKNTGSRLAVSEFSTVARLPLPAPFTNAYTAVTDATIASTFEPYIANDYNPDGSTNWEDGFRVSRFMLPRPSQTQPHLVVFITDGNPNKIINENRVDQTEYETVVPLASNDMQDANENPAANRAVSNANALKAGGSHVLALAVGAGLNSSSSLDRLIKVSGPNVFPDTQSAFDISTTDVYREPDFTQLAAALREAAFQLCAPSITVRKLVDLTPDKIGDDPQPGAGFELTAVASPTPSDWTLPTDGGTPANPNDATAKAKTDGSGFVNFQWQTTQPIASSVVITEQDPSAGVAGFPPLEFDPSKTSCTYRTPEQPTDRPLTTTPVTLGFSAEVPKDAIVTCDILNKALPAADLTLQKFTNGFDADLPPGPEIPAGQKVTWEYVAANTGNVTLTNLTVVDAPEDSGDPVPVVTCPVSTLAPGEGTTCTATGTARPGNYANTAKATATASTGGSVEASDPSHYFGPLPAISIVKKVNGDDANDPTGPLLAVGSQVNWTYDVTNTGNVDLSDVVVTDDQKVVVSCPPATTLAVGASIQCTGSGTAVAGQYANIGTATGLGAGRTVTASDPAHYFGVVASVDIEKSTNGVDADTPATAPRVPVGDPLEWTYVVTNTGNVDLNAVQVSDDKLGPITCPAVVLLAGSSFTCSVTDADPGALVGLYSNVGTVIAKDPLARVVSDTDPSHYFGSVAGIDVEKSTNGFDADLAPGPLVAVGGSIEWTYVVTNTGTEDLTGVTVVDDLEGDVACPSTLAAGATATCTAKSGTAIEGQYENVATATGLAGTTQVSDSDPSHYFGAAPRIDIEKSTNGQDADAIPGPYVPVGDKVTWRYQVTNTGNVPLTLGAPIVTDDKVTTISCPKLLILGPGQTVTCAAVGEAVAGQYANLGSVSATDPLGTVVSDEDPSHYFGSEPSIDIEKATNGNDSDLAPGQYVPVGDAVDWTYVVTNTGNLPLTDLVVVDQPTDRTDPVPVVTCPSVDLAVGASVTCTASGIARAGEYENTGTATGVSVPDGRTVTANDPSHYFGTDPSATIKKYTNGEDADTPTGPLIAVGDPVLWTYVVTNTGNVALEDVTVTDDQDVEVLLCLPLLKKLPPDKSVTCYGKPGIAVPGQYANVGKVTAVDLAGTEIGVDPLITDPSHYFGVQSSIDVEKATNGEDADNAPGPYLPVGSTVTWTYVVTNTGNTELTGLALEDTIEGPVTCPKTTLAPEEKTTCTLTGTAIEDQYTNSVTATALDPVGKEVTDNDPSNYFGANPGILVEKSTNGDDADQAPGPYIGVGEPVDWVYEVQNTGNTGLSGVSVVDDKGVLVTCPATSLAPLGQTGDSMLCTGSGVATLGQYENTATATGTDQETQALVTDTDPSHYFGFVSSIDLQKSTNGQDADSPPGPFVPVGDPVTWNYVVTNTGNIDVLSFTVKDSDPSVVIACPTVERILPTQSVSCVASGMAKAGQYENVGTVDALDVLEQPLTDTDPSHYFGAAPAIDVEKATNGQDADAAPGPRIPIGDQVTWTYVVTNKGNAPLTSVTVTDDKVGAITCPAATLAPAASMTCTTKGIAQAGQYANLATATGQFVVSEAPAPQVRLLGPKVGLFATTAAPITVTDTDPSHYFGVGPAIQIVKTPDDGEVPEGNSWTFTIRVTNIGEVPLVGVVVSDPLVPACDRSIGNLAPGASTQYDCVLDEVTEDFTNVAYVEGRSNSGIVVTDDDDARVSPAVVDETGDENGDVDNGEDLADTGADVGVALLFALLGIVLIGTGMRLSANRR